MPGFGLTAGEGEVLLRKPFRDDDVRDRVHDRDVGAGLELQVVARRDVRRAHDVNRARVDHDQLRALAHAALHLRAENRMALGDVRADQHDHVALHDRSERLRAGGFAKRVLEAITGRRMADPGAGVDVVVAEARAHQLLDQERLLVAAAGRGDAADRIPAILRLQALELARRVGDRDLPAHGQPRVRDPASDHRRRDAIGVGRVSVGEAALDAGVTRVRAALAVRHHPHHGLTLDLCIQRAAHAAIAAGGRHGAVGLPGRGQRLLGEGRRRASLDARAAGDAFGCQERLVLARDNPRIEAATFHRERERALGLVAGAYAPRAGDAETGVEGEVRIAHVPRRVGVHDAARGIGRVAHSDHRRHVLQLAVRIGGAAVAVEGMVRHIELHDTASQCRELFGPRVHAHSVGDLCRAGRRIALAALDLHQAEAA